MQSHCTNPAALDEGDLAAYLDGSAAPGVAAHLAGCAACQADLAELRAAGAALAGALGRDQCPPPDDLLAHAAGWTAPDRQAALARHLAGCVACQAELRLLNEAGAAVAAPAARPWERAAGAPLFGARQAAPPRPAALRGAGPDPLIYQADGLHLTLELLPGPDQRWTVQGTLLATDGEIELAGTPVYLIGAGAIVASDQLDELGFFALAASGDGAYSLHLDLLPRPLVIDGLELRQ